MTASAQTGTGERPSLTLSDRELLARVDERSLEVLHGHGQLMAKMAGFEKLVVRFPEAERTLIRLTEIIGRLREDVRQLKTGHKTVDKNVDRISSTVGELEDSQVIHLRELLKESRDDKRYWVRWAIGLAVTTALGITGFVIVFLLNNKR